jgi:hypothetical protein
MDPKAQATCMRCMQIGCSLPFMARSIQVRAVPERVHRTLRTRAAEAGVSLSDYVLRELERVAARPPVADVLERADSRHDGATIDQIVAAVRNGRDRR